MKSVLRATWDVVKNVDHLIGVGHDLRSPWLYTVTDEALPVSTQPPGSRRS